MDFIRIDEEEEKNETGEVLFVDIDGQKFTQAQFFDLWRNTKNHLTRCEDSEDKEDRKFIEGARTSLDEYETFAEEHDLELPALS